jgi:hypothetical protein
VSHIISSLSAFLPRQTRGETKLNGVLVSSEKETERRRSQVADPLRLRGEIDPPRGLAVATVKGGEDTAPFRRKSLLGSWEEVALYLYRHPPTVSKPAHARRQRANSLACLSLTGRRASSDRTLPSPFELYGFCRWANARTHRPAGRDGRTRRERAWR